jgi:hypothetical protein
MIGDEPVQGSAHRPFFQVALNLPHAGRIARRIVKLLPAPGRDVGADAAAARKKAVELLLLLDPCTELDENPGPELNGKIRDSAAALGRGLVDCIERAGLGEDRLGQAVRNLFECLELGQEGADISLRAGENPRSLQRPV